MVMVYAGYIVVTFFACIITDRFIRPAFPKFFSETEWNTGKNIGWMLFVILLVALCNLAYSSIMGYYLVSGTVLLQFQFTVFTYSIIPVVLFTFINCITLRKHHQAIARELNGLLQNSISVKDSGSELMFSGDNPGNDMKIATDNIIYIESAGGYCDLVYIEHGILKRTLVRITLNEVDASYKGDCLMRVHPLFLVNVCKVRSVTGNAQGYRLRFAEVDETVPVLRSKRQKFYEQMARVHPSQVAA
jgi:hypothetical protein